jgi:hypothetical protein
MVDGPSQIKHIKDGTRHVNLEPLHVLAATLKEATPDGRGIEVRVLGADYFPAMMARPLRILAGSVVACPYKGREFF